MLVTPSASFRRGGRFAGAAARRTPVTSAAARPGMVVGLLALLALPRLVGTRLPVYSTGLVFVILFLSLSLLTRVSGRSRWLTAPSPGWGRPASAPHQWNRLPVLVALIGAGMVTALVGAVIALPAMRLSGLYLALSTFAFGLLMDNVIFQTWLLFGKSGNRSSPRPQLGPIHPHSDVAFYYVILSVVAVCCLLLVGLRRARLGRLLRAMADSPTALTTLGLGLNVTRALVFRHQPSLPASLGPCTSLCPDPSVA